MSVSLLPQEIQLFRHNGFVKLPTQFSLEKITALKTEIFQNIDQAIEPVVRQNNRIIRISNLWSRGRVFRESIASHEILDPLEKLLGSNIEFVLIAIIMCIFVTEIQHIPWNLTVTLCIGLAR